MDRFDKLLFIHAAFQWAGLIAFGRKIAEGTKPGDVESADALLDLFMPKYEAVDRHKIRVDAPAELALVAATEMGLESSSGGS